MKKLRKILAVVCAATLCFAAAACAGGTKANLAVYLPDGAPALAAAKLLADEAALDGRDADYRVVAADAIGGKVADGSADVAMLPVTAAGIAAKNGYRMISVNTHGNIYLIGFGEEASLADFTGKKIGVVQLAKVPGLTLKAILAKEKLGYAQSDPTSAAAEDKVNLVPLSTAPAQPLLQGQIQALVVPEPALGSILNTLAEKGKTVSVNLALHDLYKTAFGTEQAYPQAVLVAKENLVTNAFVDDLLTKLNANGVWVKANPQAALDAVKAHLPADTNPSFTALDAAIYDRCNIYTVKAADAKENVKSYLAAVNALNPDDPSLQYAIPGDSFFYAG